MTGGNIHFSADQILQTDSLLMQVDTRLCVKYKLLLCTKLMRFPITALVYFRVKWYLITYLGYDAGLLRLHKSVDSHAQLLINM